MSNDYEITKLEIAKLELKEGDILSVKITGNRPSIAELAHLQSIIEVVVPQGVKTLLLHNNVELQIVSAAQQSAHLTKSRWAQFWDKLSAAFRR